MSLIKWKPNVQYLTKANPNMIDKVFEVRPKLTAPPRPNLPVIRDHIELLRVCSSRRQPYLSRYKLDRGRLIYACSVPLDDLTHHMQYDGRSHDGLEVHNSQLGYETCPWCATTHLGVVHCNTCGNYMCYGLTFWRGSGQFIVCVGCNMEAQIFQETNTQVGIFPKVR